MLTRQFHLNDPEVDLAAAVVSAPPQLALLFATPDRMTDPVFLDGVRQALPDTLLIGCSTAGEISTRGMNSHTAVLTTLNFEHTPLRSAHVMIETPADSRAAGEQLAQALAAPDLRAVFILSPGVGVNGSDIIAGMTAILPPTVLLTGGLAGDNGAFQKTWQLHNDLCSERQLVGVGFYGEAFTVSHGSYGGWQGFGPARLATRVEGNQLYSLDGQPALDLYTRYLGDYACDLPASGLLFPIAILNEDHSETGLIRTLLGVNEAEGSITLAGDIPPGSYLRLMQASSDALVEGAETAALAACQGLDDTRDGLALLVSCVGRKLVLGDQVEEEVEAVGSIFGSTCTLAGFYSNGEISPFHGRPECCLHNQTMTITYWSEKKAA